MTPAPAEVWPFSVWSWALQSQIPWGTALVYEMLGPSIPESPGAWPFFMGCSALQPPTDHSVSFPTFLSLCPLLQTPHLVNLKENPLIPECLLYHVKYGMTRYQERGMLGWECPVPWV